jgi:hypothetical protein
LFSDNDASFKNVIIRNNTFLNHRGRGILPRGNGVSITGNRFKDTPQAMYINTIATGYGEGPVTSEVYVANNTFDNILGVAIEVGGEAVSAPSYDSANNYQFIDNNFINVTNPIINLDFGNHIEK